MLLASNNTKFVLFSCSKKYLKRGCKDGRIHSHTNLYKWVWVGHEKDEKTKNEAKDEHGLIKKGEGRREDLIYRPA